MTKLDLTGQKFNRLTVIKSAPPIKGRTAWECVCECGTIKIIKTDELKSGGTKSCGCWNNEQRSKRAKAMYSTIIKFTPVEASARKIWKGRYGEMPFEDFYKLSQQNCYYCNEELSNYQNAAVGKNSSDDMKKNGFFEYNGLDRVDNSQPHSKENCVPCCKWCNFSKSDRSVKEFSEWLEKAYNFFVKGK